MRPPSSFVRALLLAGAVLAGLQACGRRGALESPEVAAPSPPGQAAPAPAARRVSREGHVVPNQTFILDPLL